MASVWFQYNIAPVKVHYTMYYESLAEFLVRFSAIIGGMFAAAGIMESLLRNGLCMLIPGMGSSSDVDGPPAASRKQRYQQVIEVTEQPSI